MKKNLYNAPQSHIENVIVSSFILEGSETGGGLMGGGGDGAPERRGLNI